MSEGGTYELYHRFMSAEELFPPILPDLAEYGVLDFLFHFLVVKGQRQMAFRDIRFTYLLKAAQLGLELELTRVAKISPCISSCSRF